jgi:hypothetical protein
LPLWGILGVLVFGGFLSWLQYLRIQVYGVKARILWLLFGLRISLFLVMTLMLAGPQWTRETRQERPPRLVVLFDVSESLNSAASQEQPTAFVKLRDGFFKQLYPLWQDKFQFRFYTFASQLSSTDQEKIRILENAAGPATDLRGPVVEAISQQGTNVPAAVLMLTDGNHNWGPDPTSDIFRAGKSDKPIPFIAVSTPSFGELRKSLAIHEIVLPSPAFAKEQTEIRFQVAASGIQNQEGESKLRIEFNTEGDKWVPIEKGEMSKPLPLLGSSNLGGFNAVFPKGGRYRIHLEASAPGVTSASTTREIQVEPGRWKVALYADRTGWRSGSLIRRLVNVPRFMVHAAMGQGGGDWGYLTAGLGEDNELKKSGLLSLEGVAADGDLYIFSGLSRPQYEALPAAAIRQRVEKGAAVLIVAGEGEPPSPGILEGLGLTETTPADFSTAYSAPVGRDLKTNEPASAHRATRAPAFINAAQDLPNSLMSYGSVKPAPETQVLLEFAGGDPALAVRSSGQSRTAYLGISDVWRWQFQPGETGTGLSAAFNSLVDNLIRWLLEGDAESASVPVLILSQARVPIGKPVDVGVQYARTTEDASATIRLTVTDSKQVVVPLPVKKLPGGFFTAQYIPADPGEYVFQVQDPAIPSASDEARISADPFSIETAISGAREDLLRALAGNTGGAWVDVERIGDLPKMKELDPIYEPRYTARVLTDPLMSGPGFFLLLVFLFSLEWVIRRTHDLA